MREMHGFEACRLGGCKIVRYLFLGVERMQVDGISLEYLEFR